MRIFSFQIWITNWFDALVDNVAALCTTPTAACAGWSLGDQQGTCQLRCKRLSEPWIAFKEVFAPFGAPLRTPFVVLP